ncbi:MAG: glycosyltransferase [Deltaproteobacteria bacterium]|nr:glycosyltransferase [Deltaproteobacteria bacterium]
MSNITVAIGIVTYNRLDFLKQALYSALIEEQFIKEIIVVDDGSTDGTKEYLQSLNNPKVKPIIHQTNQGRPTARNSVVQNLTSDFLIWLDDDDSLIPGIIKSHLTHLSKNPSAQVIYGNLIMSDENLTPYKQLTYRQIPANQVLLNLLFEDVFPQPGTMIHNSVFKLVGPYDSRKLRAQDYDFWARAAIAGCSFSLNNTPVVLYRQHKQNLANPEEVRHQSKYQCEIIEHILAHAKIENIFSTFDWSNKAQESAAQAMQIVAKIFFDHGNDALALECIDHSLSFVTDPRSAAMKAMILRAQNNLAAATEQFSHLAMQIFPDLNYMYQPIGAPRGSLAVAEKGKGN